MSGRFDEETLKKYDDTGCPFHGIPTLEECTNYYVDRIIRHTLSANTYTNFRSISKHVIETIGGYALEELNSRIIQCYIDTKAVSGRKDQTGGLSPKTLQEHRNFLNGFFNLVVKWGLMAANPCTGVKIPKQKKPEVKTLNSEDQKKVCTNISSVFQLGSLLPARLALLQGMRIGEVCALKLEDIDLEMRFITIDESLKRACVYQEETGSVYSSLFYGTTKSKKTRIIPMCQETYTVLKQYIDTMPDTYRKNQAQPLFMNTKGTVMEPRLLNYHFYKFCIANEIQNIRFHDLRHTFATNALEADMEINTLSKILGHANTSITQNIYVHVTQNQMKKEMAKMNIGSTTTSCPIPATC